MLKADTVAIAYFFPEFKKFIELFPKQWNIYVAPKKYQYSSYFSMLIEVESYFSYVRLERTTQGVPCWIVGEGATAQEVSLFDKEALINAVQQQIEFFKNNKKNKTKN